MNTKTSIFCVLHVVLICGNLFAADDLSEKDFENKNCDGSTMQSKIASVSRCLRGKKSDGAMIIDGPANRAILLWAAKHKRAAALKEIFELSAGDPRVQKDPKNKHNDIKLCLEYQDTDGNTPLHHAVLKNNMDIVQELLGQANNCGLEQKDYIGIKNKKNESSFDLAQGDVKTYLEGIINIPKNIVIEAKDEPLVKGEVKAKEESAIESEEKEKEQEVVVEKYFTTTDDDALSKQAQGMTNEEVAHPVNENNDTALHLAARYGKLKTVEELLKKGISADAVNKNKVTPLHEAASNGHLDIVKMLVGKINVAEQKSYIEKKNNNGKRALDLAITHDVKTYLESIINPPKKEEPILVIDGASLKNQLSKLSESLNGLKEKLKMLQIGLSDLKEKLGSKQSVIDVQEKKKAEKEAKKLAKQKAQEKKLAEEEKAKQEEEKKKQEEAQKLAEQKAQEEKAEKEAQKLAQQETEQKGQEEKPKELEEEKLEKKEQVKQVVQIPSSNIQKLTHMQTQKPKGPAGKRLPKKKIKDLFKEKTEESKNLEKQVESENLEKKIKYYKKVLDILKKPNVKEGIKKKQLITFANMVEDSDKSVMDKTDPDEVLKIKPEDLAAEIIKLEAILEAVKQQ